MMCILVDANAAHDLSKKSADGRPVMNWLLNDKKKSGLVVGGKLIEELIKAGLSETLKELSRAGKLHRVSNAALSRREKTLRCKSNDAHVVALVLEAQCTVVFTKDKILHVDLKNHMVNDQKIAIYQKAAHSHLLQECRCKS